MPTLKSRSSGITIDEMRIPRRRWPGYKVVDRCLIDILERTTVVASCDLWSLVPPECDGREPFTTTKLAQTLERPLSFAQRVAYCLRLTGAARVVGKQGNRLIYIRDSASVYGFSSDSNNSSRPIRATVVDVSDSA